MKSVEDLLLDCLKELGDNSEKHKDKSEFEQVSIFQKTITKHANIIRNKFEPVTAQHAPTVAPKQD